jgi:hypothetical protein
VRRHPILAWTLRVLRAAQLVLLLLFSAYFVCVQINATAYLAGRNHPMVGGTAPPVPLHSDAAAVAGIIAGLVFEAIVAFVIFIVAALFRPGMRRKRYKVSASV